MPSKQKILSLLKGTKKPGDQDLLCDLPLNLNKGSTKICTFTVIGTPEEDLQRIQSIQCEHSLTSQDTVFNDLAIEFSTNTAEWQRLNEFTLRTTINFIASPRPGKKLLVLDLDHTILDFSGSSSDNRIQIDKTKRPYMDEFLTSVYAHYDLAIWSQTHWKWIEIKITELGLLTSNAYRICFILDKTSMFSMPSSLKGSGTKEGGKVKPLHIIWSKFPQFWGKHNTLQVDDLMRNFELNRSNGILVTPFYREKNGRKMSKTCNSEGTIDDGGGGKAGVEALNFDLVLSRSIHSSSSISQRDSSTTQPMPMFFMDPEKKTGTDAVEEDKELLSLSK